MHHQQQQQQKQENQAKMERRRRERTASSSIGATCCGQGQGVVDAQYYIGLSYFYGICGTGCGVVSENRSKAARCWRQAADQGSAKARYFLGECYTFGEGVAKNESIAVHMYRQAMDQIEQEARAGDPDSQYLYGHAFYNGNGGIGKDYAQAVLWYQLAAQQGNVHAQNNLGWCYQNGHGVDLDRALALVWYERGAQHGFAGAQFNLGWCYQNGFGVDIDLGKAVEWYKKAADQNFAEAQNNLGWAHENGIGGLERDMKKAFDCYWKAATYGIADAQNNLGMCFHKGDGVELNYELAVQWFEKAVAQNYGVAQFNLAWCLEHGTGVREKDYRRAAELYNKAASQDIPDSQDSLMILMKCCKLAVTSEYAVQAMQTLAYGYEQGAGVTANAHLAQAWQEEANHREAVVLASSSSKQQQPQQLPFLLTTTTTTTRSSTAAAGGGTEKSSSASCFYEGKCVCCEETQATVSFLHGQTGHTCCCLVCAHACEDKCPICRLEIDKLVLQLPCYNHDNNNNSNNICMGCGSAQVVATLVHGETGHACCCWNCALNIQQNNLPCYCCQGPVDRIFLNYNV